MPDRPMVVVADTSPLQHLYQLGHLDLLRELYGAVLISGAVAAELAAGLEPGVRLPSPVELPWLLVVQVTVRDQRSLPAGLGPGEREALALATAEPGALLIVDDLAGRRAAASMGLAHTGTLGVLLRAAEKGCISRVGDLLDELDRLGFRLDAGTRAAVLRIAGV